jgi:hypothetical protein
MDIMVAITPEQAGVLQDSMQEAEFNTKDEKQSITWPVPSDCDIEEGDWVFFVWNGYLNVRIQVSRIVYGAAVDWDDASEIVLNVLHLSPLSAKALSPRVPVMEFKGWRYLSVNRSSDVGKS